MFAHVRNLQLCIIMKTNAFLHAFCWPIATTLAFRNQSELGHPSMAACGSGPICAGSPWIGPMAKFCGLNLDYRGAFHKIPRRMISCARRWVRVRALSDFRLRCNRKAPLVCCKTTTKLLALYCVPDLLFLFTFLRECTATISHEIRETTRCP